MLLTELKKGWWRITDLDQLKTVLQACHPRGIREKELQKCLSKFVEHAEINPAPLKGM